MSDLIVGAQRLRTRRMLLCATTILAAGLAAPAYAQSDTEQPAPPNASYVDGNGVNLLTGGFSISSVDTSIGGADGGLSYSHTARAFGSNDQYVINIVTRFGGGVHVNIGEMTDLFPAAGQPSQLGTGATLSSNATGYVYTTRDGVVYQFSADYHSDKIRVADQRAASITYPGGRVVRLAYETGQTEFCKPNTHQCFGTYFQLTRVSSVTSNDGYRLTFTYDSDFLPDVSYAQGFGAWMAVKGVVASNDAVAVCTPASCPAPSTTWPSVTYTWDSSDTVQTTTTSEGHKRAIVYDSSNRVSAVRNAAGVGILTFTYDSSNRVATATRPGAGTWHYSYADNTAFFTTTVTDPLGNQRIVTRVDYTGQLASDQNGAGEITQYAMNTDGTVHQVTYPDGSATTYTYDSRQNAKDAVTTPGTGSGTITTHASFPASCSTATRSFCNKPATTTDAAGHVTNYSYDTSTGQLTKVTHPSPDGVAARPEERYGYTALHAWYKNASGVLVQDPAAISKLTSVSQCITGSSCAGTANEVKTVIAYGASGVANNLLPSAVTRGAGDGSVSQTVAMTYTAAGDVASVDGPLTGTADTTNYVYDLDRERIGAVSPDPDGTGALLRRAVRTSYDDDGLVTKVEVGTGNANLSGFVSKQQLTSSTDSYGRKVKDALTAGGTTTAVSQYSYDADGRLKCAAVRMNAAAWGTQTDACDANTTGSLGPDRVTLTQYDGAGRVASVTSGADTPDASTESQAYVDGHLASVTDAEGNTTSYSYDGFGRLAKIAYPNKTKGSGTSSTTDYEQFTYDNGVPANGTITSRRLRDGTSIAYSYDRLNRLTAKTLPGSEPTVSYAYDNLGRPTAISQPGNALSFSYDALSRLLTETGPQGTLTSTWDAAGRRTKLQWPDGFYVTYAYDVLGEMTKVRENGASSGVGVLASYTYDDLGNRTGATNGNGTTSTWTPDVVSRLHQLVHNLGGSADDLTKTFTYNPANGIASSTSSNDAYAWDAAANATRAYTSNGLDQYTAAGGVTFGYDARGNLTNSPPNSYTYTSENLMKTGPGSTTLSYDPLLRLYQVTSGATTTRFAYDGLEMVAEYNASNVLQKRYVYGPGVDEPIVQYDGTGTASRSWLHADERGSIIALTNSAGAVTAINSYDEFGIPGSANTGRFQYTGQEWLPEIGLYYYKARMYSPSLGRFMQTDPIGYADGLNWYNYAGGDPVNFVDPLGFAQTININGVTCTINTDGEGNPISYSCPSDPFGGGGETVVVTGSNPPPGHPLSPPVPNQPIGGPAPPTPSRGGIAAPQRQQQQKTVKQCLVEVAKKDGVSLGLDIAGAAIPGVSTAATLGKLGVSGAALVNNAVHATSPSAVGGIGLGIADFHLASAGKFAEDFKNVSKVAKAIPFVGAFVSATAAGIDVYTAYQDYKSCRAGN